MPIIIAIVVVGGIAVFSVYLQQDEAVVEIRTVAEPYYHCLEKWDTIGTKII